MSDYYDREGRPMEMMAWTRRFSNLDYKRVASDYDGDVHVSTVWLGLDHSFGEGPPLIFETLVFGGPLDGEMDRYSTLEQARAGHAAMLERVKTGAKP